MVLNSAEPPTWCTASGQSQTVRGQPQTKAVASDWKEESQSPAVIKQKIRQFSYITQIHLVQPGIEHSKKEKQKTSKLFAAQITKGQVSLEYKEEKDQDSVRAMGRGNEHMAHRELTAGSTRKKGISLTQQRGKQSKTTRAHLSFP